MISFNFPIFFNYTFSNFTNFFVMSWSGLQKGKSEENEIYEDELDETDNNNSHGVTYWKIIFLIFSLIWHFLDVIIDFYVALGYYTSGKYVYFGWTITFVLIPSIIMTIISIRMYVADIKKNLQKKRYGLLRMFLCVFGMIIQAALVIRFIDSLRYAIKTLVAESQGNHKQQTKYYRKLVYEQADVAFLRLFECYLESAPQVVLQITLLMIDLIDGSNTLLILRLVMVTLSCLGMGACMATYHDIIKEESKFFEESTKAISKVGLVVQFFWHWFFTVSRVVALSTVAILYPLWTVVGVLIHWFIMSVWLGLTSSTHFCGKNSGVLELFFSSAVALIYIFNFITLKEGSTKYSYVVFDSLCGIENLVASIVWGLERNLYVPNWLYYSFLILPNVGFVLGVLLQVIYYKYLHPNKRKSGFRNEENIYFSDNRS